MGSQQRWQSVWARPVAFAGLIMLTPVAQATETGGKEAIISPDAPAPGGSYSQAVKVGNLVFLAGQLAFDPKTRQLDKEASIEDQTRRTLDNIKAVLSADGLTMDNIVSTTVYMKDIGEFSRMNEAYSSYFKSVPPARATVEVARLPREAKIEISAIAVRP